MKIKIAGPGGTRSGTRTGFWDYIPNHWFSKYLLGALLIGLAGVCYGLTLISL